MSDMFKPVETTLPVKRGFWNSFRAFWLQEVNIELTPKQQKIEDELNEFLFQEVTWQKVHDFLFQEVTFGKKNKQNSNEIANQNENQNQANNIAGYNTKED